MKRWIPFIALSLVLIFVGGIFLGSASEADHQGNFWVARLNIQNTIAVVNSDIGAIDENGQRLNYSAAIIQALDEEFTQVSPAYAETGFLDGTFGAVITFPSYVSERVLTFNDRYPRSIQLEFMINPNLPEREYIETYLRILNLQMSINSTLSHTYISSIFSQFHEGQDQVADIFQNIEDNLTAMEIISLEQFTPSLNLEYVPVIPFEPNAFDGSGHLTSIEGFASAVASLYLGSYSAASASYLSMREGLFAMTDDIPQQAEEWLANLQSWAEEWEYFADDLSGQRERHEGMIDELNVVISALNDYWYDLDRVVTMANEFFDDLYTWHEELDNNRDVLEDFHTSLVTNVDGINSDIDLINIFLEDLITWHDYLQGWFDALEQWNDLPAWVDQLRDDHAALQTQLDDVGTRPERESFPNTPQGEEEYIAAVGVWYVEVFAASANTLLLINQLEVRLADPIYNVFVNNISEFNPRVSLPDPVTVISREDLEGLIWNRVARVEGLYIDEFDEDIPDELEPIVLENQPDVNTPASAEGFLEPLAELRSQLASFEVDDFLTDELWYGVEGQIAGFGTYLDFVRDLLGFHAEGNNMLLTTIYFEYTNYLMGLRRDAFAAEAYEIENLHERLEEFYEIHDATRLDTIARLLDFSEMMPESRTEAGINRALIEHTVTPFEFVPPVMRADISSNMFNGGSIYDRFGRFLWIGIPLLALVFLVTVGSYGMQAKKKEEDEEGL